MERIRAKRNFFRRAKWNVLGGALLLMAALLVSGLWWFRDSPLVAWRIRLVHLKLLNALPDESWSRVVQRLGRFSVRGGPVPWRLEQMRVALVLDSPQDVEEGEHLFQRHCSQCHGAGGQGAMGPDLTSPSFQARVLDSDIYHTITEGVEGTSMQAFHGSTPEGLRLAAFVRSLADDLTKRESEQREAEISGHCASCASIDVRYEQLRSADQNPRNWLTYSGTYNGQRFSSLGQINRDTISRLRPRWVYQMKSLEGVQSTPLVVDGVMIVTGPENEVMALDAGTGEELWTFRRMVPNTPLLENGKKNRGVAILGKRVYHAALDGHLIALDLSTGQPVWDVQVAKPEEGFSLTAAPLAVKDKIIVGVAGGDFGTRGFLDAYDAASGKRVWRFYTIPEPGQPGHETWENDAWKTGGGGTWITGSFDPELNLLYWGVGNPTPSFDGDSRPGDNLYTGSVLALDPDNGTLQWHYQFTPHDTNDWDAAAVPVLADLAYQGELRKLLLWANRNCFFYVLDRETGRFLQATEYCEQNWNDGFSPEGRPIRRSDTRPSAQGTTIHPSFLGGSSWYSPAYSPRTGMYYVTYRIRDDTMYLSKEEFDLGLGRQFLGGWSKLEKGGRNTGALRAIDAATGKIVWEKAYEGLPSKAGLLATAADLLFTVDDAGMLYALDARTGEEVWKLRLGGQVEMGPVTYLHDGKQQLALIARGSLCVLDLVE